MCGAPPRGGRAPGAPGGGVTGGDTSSTPRGPPRGVGGFIFCSLHFCLFGLPNGRDHNGNVFSGGLACGRPGPKYQNGGYKLGGQDFGKSSAGRILGVLGRPRAPGWPETDSPRHMTTSSGFETKIRALGSGFVAIFRVWKTCGAPPDASRKNLYMAMCFGCPFASDQILMENAVFDCVCCCVELLLSCLRFFFLSFLRVFFVSCSLIIVVVALGVVS